MDLSFEDVEKILRLIDESSLEELHVEIGEFKLVVRKRAARDGGPEPAPPPERESPAPSPPAATTPAGEAGAARVAAAAPASAARAGEVEVKAPMVGTFYRAPSPGAPPFVEVGSTVAEDDTLCIIEVMKLMTSIRAGCRGRVAAICADNGALVEFGQTLMVIEPRP